MILDEELHRILLKRIEKSLEKARYYPGEMVDTKVEAEKILKPWSPLCELTQLRK